MQNKAAITVNGVMLSEFVKDKELLEAEHERCQLLQVVTEKVYINKGFRPKYKPTTERNGRVKKLNQREINISVYENELRSAILDNNPRVLTIVMLLCNPHDTVFTSNKVAKLAHAFAKEHGLDISPRINFPIRTCMGKFRQTKLAQFMISQPRKEGQPAYYQFTKEALESLTLLEAVRYSKTHVPQAPRKKTKQEQTPLTESVPVTREVKRTTDNAIYHAKRFLDGLNIKFTGDIHIHIHLKNDE